MIKIYKLKYENCKNIKIQNIKKFGTITLKHLIMGPYFIKESFYHTIKIEVFDDYSLIFYENNKIVALFSGAVIDKKLISHPGASFGGCL